MISVKKHGSYEVFSRGSEEPWAIWRDGRPYRQVWTWKEVDEILREDPAKSPQVAAKGAETPAYRVAYLVPNPRRGQQGQETMLRLWYAGGNVLQTMADALADLRTARRRGYTAWITDTTGRHVPVKGAMRPYPDPYSV